MKAVQLQQGILAAVTVSCLMPRTAPVRGDVGLPATGASRCEVQLACERTKQHAAAPATPRASAARALTSEERRVVDWLVDRILHLEPSDAPVVDFSGDLVAAATGIDVAKLDPDRVRSEVVARLRTRGFEARREVRPAAAKPARTQASAKECETPDAAFPEARVPSAERPQGGLFEP